MKIIDQFIRFPLNNGLIIARSGGHRVFVMNASARFIWELLETGMAPAQIPSRMAAHYGIDVSQAERDLRRTLEQWRREGLASAPRDPQYRYNLGGITFSIRYSDPRI